MSMSVIVLGAECPWPRLDGKVTLAGTGARVVETGRGGSSPQAQESSPFQQPWRALQAGITLDRVTGPLH